MAEGVFRRVAEEEGVLHLFEIDSAGLGDWHVGQRPTRARKVRREIAASTSPAKARGRSRRRYDRFDLLLAMDGSNQRSSPSSLPKLRATKFAASRFSRPGGDEGRARSLLWRKRRLRIMRSI
jgi:protein-tyrosine phosphatase